MAAHSVEQENLLDSIRDFAVFTCNLNGIITAWNSGAELLFGWDKAEAVGSHSELIFTTEDRSTNQPEQEMQTALELGYAQNKRWHLHKEGMRFFVDGTLRLLFDDAGNVRGFIRIARDATIDLALEQTQARLRQSEARQSFLLEMGDHIGSMLDPIEIISTAARLLGTFLQVDRVGYAEIDLDAAMIDVRVEWQHTTMETNVRRVRMSANGPEMAALLQTGRPWIIEDIETDERTTVRQTHDVYAKWGVRATIAMPLIKAGRWVAALYITTVTPRQWQTVEIELLRDVAERIWDAAERARSEQNLRLSEEKYRTLFNSMDEGVSMLKLITNEAGQVVDYWVKETNPALTRLTGLHDIAGRRIRAILPQLEDEWFARLQEVMHTGESMRFEMYIQSLDGWFDIYIVRVDGADSQTIAIVYHNITKRKHAEAEQRRAEAQLRQAEQRRLMTMEATGVGDWEYDLVMDAVYWSPRMYELFDLRRDYRLNAETVISLFEAEDRPQVNAIFQRALVHADGGYQHFQARVRHVDGALHWLEVRGQSIFDDLSRPDRPTRLVGMVIDITAQKQSESAERDRRVLAERLRDAATSLNSTFDLPELMSKAIAAVHRLIACDGVYVVLADHGAVRCFLDSDLPATEQVALEVWHHRLAALDDAPLYHHDTHAGQLTVIDDPTRARMLLPLEALHTVIVVPLCENETHMGCLVLFDRRAGELEKVKTLVIQAFAYQLVAAICNARLFVQAQELASLQERQNIARDLHDAVSQTLFTASLMGESLLTGRNWDATEKTQILMDIVQLIRGAQAEMRTLLMELRPMQLRTTPLDQLMLQLIDAVRARKRLNITLDFVGEAQLPIEVHIVAYRITQEALNNIAKHAGATQVWLHVRAGSGMIGVTIVDDGIGFDSHLEKPGLGLTMMRERADEIGAQFGVSSRSHGGTTVRFLWMAQASSEALPLSQGGTFLV